MSKCDFCSLPDPTVVFPAVDFMVSGMEGIAASRSDWWACNDCAKLINADDWDQLAVRTWDSMTDLHGGNLSREEGIAFVKQLHAQFNQSRCAEFAE